MSTDPAFIGHAQLDQVASLSAPVKVTDVTFTDGAVTHWHSHEGGQVLVVIDGAGRYQERGRPELGLATGEIIVAPAGVDHWHGAAPGSDLHQVAISGGQTIWKDAPDLAPPGAQGSAAPTNAD